MKRILVFILSIFVCFSLLCSCDTSHSTNGQITQAVENSDRHTLITTKGETTQAITETESDTLLTTDDESTQTATEAESDTLLTTDDETAQMTEDTAQNSSVVIETPPDKYTYAFNSYEEVDQALTDKASKEYTALREEQICYGKVYQNTLDKFSTGEIKIAIPQINKNPISLRNKEGYSNISLLTSELYDLPWLWHHCIINDQDLDVKISYLNAICDLEIKPTATYTDILQLIAPDAPSPENYEKYESYKRIYEKQISLKDGANISVMISELKNSSDVYVMFYYDGLLITLSGNNELLSDEFWQSFSIAYN